MAHFKNFDQLSEARGSKTPIPAPKFKVGDEVVWCKYEDDLKTERKAPEGLESTSAWDRYRRYGSFGNWRRKQPRSEPRKYTIEQLDDQKTNRYKTPHYLLDTEDKNDHLTVPEWQLRKVSEIGGKMARVLKNVKDNDRYFALAQAVSEKIGAKIIVPDDFDSPYNEEGEGLAFECWSVEGGMFRYGSDLAFRSEKEAQEFVKEYHSLFGKYILPGLNKPFTSYTNNYLRKDKEDEDEIKIVKEEDGATVNEQTLEVMAKKLGIDVDNILEKYPPSTWKFRGTISGNKFGI